MNRRNINYPSFVDTKRISVENYGYDDESYRFLLKVPFKTNGNNFLRVIMKNPSKANEQTCDMTMIKVCNAAHRAFYDGVIIMNLFPYRATYATDLHKNYYNGNEDIYNKSMRVNKEVIESNCRGSEVVFAWGTNTINKTKAFEKVYENIASDIMNTVLNCAERAVSTYKGNGKYPLHALMWWNEILIESDVLVDGFEPDEKHLVLHRNMFGPSAEVCNTNPEDLNIYCYKRNKICIPDCKKCKYFRGDENGLGIACEWEDFEGNISWDESVIQHYERALEYDRVQYAKTTFCKKDLDRYMEWLKNYEK